MQIEGTEVTHRKVLVEVHHVTASAELCEGILYENGLRIDQYVKPDGSIAHEEEERALKIAYNLHNNREILMSTILNRAFIKREIFDPKNKAHMKSFEHFIRTGNWGEIQFFAELPYAEAPMTVLMKFAEHVTKVKRETPIERGARFATMGLVAPTRGETSAEKQERHERARQSVMDSQLHGSHHGS